MTFPSRISLNLHRVALPAAWLAGIAGIFIAVGSCAPTLSGATAAGPEPASSRGTILAIRPVLPNGTGAGVLNGLAGSAASAGQLPAGQSLDYIVREASGGTISVVQTDELHFQVGDPVVIVRGDRTRLARPGA